MSTPGDEVEVEVDETVVVSRRARRRAADSESAAPASADDEFAHEATVVVDRSRSSDAAAADVPADDEFAHEATVVVNRSRSTTDSAPDAPADDEFAHEATVVVNRSRSTTDSAPDESASASPADPDADGAVDERTIAIDRSQPAESTPAEQSAEASPDEATVAVPRRGPRLLRRRSPAPADTDGTVDDTFPADTVPRSTTSFERPAGLTNPAIYKPRPAPLVPSAPPVQVQGASAPTRTLDPARPSVAKGAVRESRLTLAAFVAACVVSVVGLTGLVFLIIG
ncbi:hypothetical protein [uncultured Microbacterium sp.]|uniref:hypothetical protein n=1 Tax=uncultured Microbacterium sp. TaxID=191216 RepID=UPI0028DBBD75|nr:hypothetical protein [uncultured Microbacterium sp.]